MGVVLSFLRSARALVLLAALVCAEQDPEHATSQLCSTRGRNDRVRGYPVDGSAVCLLMPECGLTKVNETDLIGLPDIRSIYLSDNALATIDPGVFRYAPTLSALYLDGNTLRELPAFPDHSSCPSLTYLNLSKNKLTRINAGTLSACIHLRHLCFDKNEIEYIDSEAFTSLPKLEKVILNDNKLILIHDNLFLRNTKLQMLYLNNNRLMYISQGFASTLKRAGWGLDQFYFYDNPWPCGCLLELLADVKRAGVLSYTGVIWQHTYDGERPECVYIGAVPCPRRRSGLLAPTLT